MQKEKAPNTAATVQGARKMEHIQGENTTKSPAGQGLFQAASALDDLGTQLSVALGLLNLVADSLELAPHPEGSRMVLADTLTMYTDSLWVLADHLRTAKEAVQKDTARLYQERRRVP